MRKLITVAVPAGIVGLGLLFNANVSFGKAEYTTKEKKPCTFCHTSAKSKELNDAGKYYQKNKTLEGYKK